MEGEKISKVGFASLVTDWTVI